jgi:hypothetical protein
MILLNEVAKSGPYMVVYKDHADPKLFYYIPRFAELAKKDDGSLIFGHQLFRRDPNNPKDGFSVYNFTVRSVMPGVEYENTKKELEQMVGSAVSIVPIPGFDLRGKPLTDLSYVQIGGNVQSMGGNLFTDLAVSLTFIEDCEPDMSKLFKSNAGWTGEIDYKLTGALPVFLAKITANWHAVQEHFRSQVSVKYWFVSANISYETQKLIQNGVIKVDIIGGTAEDKDKVWTLANKIAERLFVQTLQPAPLPDHPSGSVICFSLNFSKTEEDKVTEYTFESREIATRDLGLAIVVGNVPDSYFPSLNNPIRLSGDLSLGEQIKANLEERNIRLL